jgi:hypothetical protein
VCSFKSVIRASRAVHEIRTARGSGSSAVKKLPLIPVCNGEDARRSGISHHDSALRFRDELEWTFLTRSFAGRISRGGRETAPLPRHLHWPCGRAAGSRSCRAGYLATIGIFRQRSRRLAVIGASPIGWSWHRLLPGLEASEHCGTSHRSYPAGNRMQGVSRSFCRKELTSVCLYRNSRFPPVKGKRLFA